ncbi:hypothetical protein [Fibrobacter sp.]|uniref:hypothetical protein n=1 Tax=Fibrobacter sp. TaxID=35828 RepID=UPI0025BCA5A5|nr:hypothetical protein [Fibrobacter sp.]MBR3072238.1 hypothetical protein [Fibrobacter sp.]
MVKKLSCVIPLMVLLSCSSDSNDPVMPIAGENHLSSSDAENLRGTSSDSGSEHNDSSTGENLSSDGSDEILSSGSPDKPLSNGTSLSSGIPLSSSSSVSSGSVSASSVVENGSELKYQVFDVTTSASSQGYIAGSEVQFIGNESLSDGEVPLPADVHYINLNANGEYDRVSFVSPMMKSGVFDTVTFALDGDCTLKGLCYIGSTQLVCYTKNDCTRCYSASKYNPARITEKTLFINYGPNKITDAMPVYDIPALDSVAFRAAFAQLDYKTEDYLSGQIFSNYQLQAKGLPEGMSFKSSPTIPQSSSSYYPFPFSSSQTIFVMNACIDQVHDRYPFAYVDKQKVNLYNASAQTLKNDTTITWTLVYTDQFGRQDSLAVTTKFKATKQ